MSLSREAIEACNQLIGAQTMVDFISHQTDHPVCVSCISIMQQKLRNMRSTVIGIDTNDVPRWHHSMIQGAQRIVDVLRADGFTAHANEGQRFIRTINEQHEANASIATSSANADPTPPEAGSRDPNPAVAGLQDDAVPAPHRRDVGICHDSPSHRPVGSHIPGQPLTPTA